MLQEVFYVVENHPKSQICLDFARVAQEESFLKTLPYNSQKR